MMSDLTDLSLDEIDKANNEESDKMYAIPREWKKSLGSGASYEALARLLDEFFIRMHDLKERYCHDKSK